VISRHELPKLSANRVLQVGGKELAERKIDLESEAAGNRELKAPCIPRTPAKAPDARVAWSDACHADDPPTARSVSCKEWATPASPIWLNRLCEDPIFHSENAESTVSHIPKTEASSPKFADQLGLPTDAF